MIASFDNLNTLLAEWLAQQPLKKDDHDRLWRKIRLDWNYHSNRIEGNTLTYGETEILLIHGQATGDHDLRDYMEMQAHDVAIDHMKTLVAEERPLTEGDIRDFNRILIKEPFWKDAITPDGQPSRIQILPGEYKKQPNNVRTASGEIFRFADPSDVPIKMGELITWLRDALEKHELHPIEIASKLHHDFVLIHPFGDGNGRTARILVNYVLMRNGYLPLVVPTQQKDRYLAALRRADAGELDALTNYLATCLEASMTRGVAAGKGENIEEPSDVEKQIALFIRQQKAQASTSVLSKEVLQGLMISSIRPFIEKLENRMRTLAPLFSRMDVMAIDGNGEVASGPGFIFHGNFEKLGSRRKIIFTFIYETYQENAPSPFDFQSAVEVQFSQEEYVITHDTTTVASRPYTKPLLAEEIDRITSGILAKAFEEIRSLACPTNWLA